MFVRRLPLLADDRGKRVTGSDVCPSSMVITPAPGDFMDTSDTPRNPLVPSIIDDGWSASGYAPIEARTLAYTSDRFGGYPHGQWALAFV
jgi:hypothetical protein